jgi:hypothetical protein
MFGLELAPYSEGSKRQDRKHYLKPEELEALRARSDEDLWKDYVDTQHRGLYAPNVPHVAVHLRGGVIPPKYLSRPDPAQKTSSELSKETYQSYYADPLTQRRISDEMDEHSVLVRQQHDGKYVFRRYADSRGSGDRTPLRIERPADVGEHARQHAVEFHKVIGPTTKRIWVDLDPQEGFGLGRTKTVAQMVADEMAKIPEVKNTAIRFSGNRGFYVEGQLHTESSTDAMRERLKEALSSSWTTQVGPHHTEEHRVHQGTLLPGLQDRVGLCPGDEAGASWIHTVQGC